MHVISSFFILLLPFSVLAWDAPNYPGFRLLWQETFTGDRGTLPNQDNWKVIKGNLSTNEELQIYTADTTNLRLSGDGTLQIVPWKVNGSWMSGRIESIYTLTPGRNKITRVESSLRLGNHDLVRKKGFWPAFWMMGSSSQHGVRWPDCGEIDIMENKFDWSEGYGTVHYAKDQYLTGTIETPDHGTDWHTWRVEIDRRSDSFSEQSIVWYLDGKEFHRVRGDTINDEAIWTRVAQSPMFIILNLAVGGKFAGNPDKNTLDGYGSMVEFRYIAHYSTCTIRWLLFWRGYCP